MGQAKAYPLAAYVHSQHCPSFMMVLKSAVLCSDASVSLSIYSLSRLHISFIVIKFLHLLVQCLLPPVAPVVRRRVHNLGDPGDIQILDGRVRSVHLKVRNTGSIRRAILCEIRDIFLQSHSNLWGDNSRIGSIVIGVGHVFSMSCRRNAEEVGVCVVLVSFVKVKRVACEGAVSHQY